MLHYMSMNEETNNSGMSIEEKIDAIYVSVEKTRKYFLIVMWVTLGAFVLPAIGLLFAIPAFINTYTTSLNGLL